MHIAMVFDGLQIGGVERVGADYAKILCDMGHQVTVINLNSEYREMEKEFPIKCKVVNCKFKRKYSPENYFRMNEKGGKYVIAYPLLYFLTSVFNRFYRIYCHISNTYLKKNYDIAIAFAGHTNDLSFVANSFVKSKKRMCWLHGALYSYLLMSKGYLKEYIKIKNLVVSVDDAQEEVLIYHPGLNLNIKKLYNPILINNKAVNENKVNELRKTYGKFAVMVARFSYPQKDQYTVAEAIKIVREKYGDDINLVFIGDGPEKEKVRSVVNSFNDNIKNHIFFESSKMDLQNYYSAAYVLLHASVAGEGLPTVILEAMANNLPTIVTNSKTGPYEILKDNQFGLLCQVKDPEDMAQKVHLLINNEELYKHYQEMGKERIKDFDYYTISDQLKMILENLV